MLDTSKYDSSFGTAPPRSPQPSPTQFALVIVAAFVAYGIRVTAGTGRRRVGSEAKRIERSVNAATVIELVASFALPGVVVVAGHNDWVLPSIAISIGPLLLWLDHLVHIPRYRPVGWALTLGPVILVTTMSGSRSPHRSRCRHPPARHRRRRIPRPGRPPNETIAKNCRAQQAWSRGSERPVMTRRS